MPEWFDKAFHSPNHVTLGVLVLRLVLSLVLGCVVAGIYVLTQRRSRAELISFTTTLLLMTVLITMVTLVIADNLARAFSLAGALAIIRFRTVVEDTRDTAFVIFAVVVGMAVGVGLIVVALVGVPLVAGAAFALRLWGAPKAAGTGDASLIVRIGLGRDPEELLRPYFDRHLASIRLRSTTTARQGSSLDLTYLVRLRQENGAVAFVTQLNQVEGIQSVELRLLGDGAP